MSEFKLPSEIITLPSKGLNLYPEENILNTGEVEMKYMGAKQEDILTNANYIRQGVVIDRLLESMILTKIDFNDLLVGDKNAILVAARVLGLGKDYTVSWMNNDGKVIKSVADLSILSDKVVDRELLLNSKNSFKLELPVSKNNITFRLLTHGDEQLISKDIQGLKKLFPDQEFNVSVKLKSMITSVNGDTNKATVSEFVDAAFIKNDIDAFLDYYSKISPDIDMKFIPSDSDYTGEGIIITPGLDFFWSKLGI